MNRIRTFVDDQDRRTFLRLLGIKARKGHLIVHAFCLMPNHYHLLCETPTPELHKWMHWILSVYSQQFNVRHGRHGYLWESRYRALLVEDGDYFLECSRYIHLNPCKAGIACTPDDYDWSSFGSYTDGRGSVPWVHTERTRQMFDRPEDYVRFVSKRLGAKMDSPFDLAAGGVVFGSTGFIRRIASLIDVDSENRVAIAHQLQREMFFRENSNLQEILKEQSALASRTEALQAMVHTLGRLDYLRPVDISRITGKSRAWISRIRRTLAERMLKDPQFGGRIADLSRRFEKRLSF